MSRLIDVYAVQDNTPRRLSHAIARATGITLDKRRGSLCVGGCGMDMGFHVVYELSAALYRDGFDCIGARCPSNAHSNGDRDYTPHVHKDGGYALAQRWM